MTTSFKPVTGFIVIAWDKNTPPKDAETLIWIKKDVNSNHRGKYVFIGMYYEQKSPVTSIDFLIQDEPEPRTPAGWESNDVDLNSGAGGKYIYLIWKRGEMMQPITEVQLVETEHYKPPHIDGWTVVNRDLAAGCGGSFIFAYYVRMPHNLSTYSTR